MKRKFEFVFSWLFIMAVSSFILWYAVKGLDRLFSHRHYSTRKPINYDKPKLDTVTFDDGHTEVFKLDTAD